MKKVNLSFMAVMIISLVIILIMNTMSVFAYRDQILTIESQKNNLLSLNLKYASLLDKLYSNALQYLDTNDEKYKSDVYNLRNSYFEKDNITLEYRIFTESQISTSLKKALLNADFTLSSQAEYVQFTKEEQRLYIQFLKSYHVVLERILTAVNNRNDFLLTNPEYDHAVTNQEALMSTLTNKYIDRLNRTADHIIFRQRIAEYSLVGICLILLGFATVTFYLILRENAFNSYFRKLYNTIVENFEGGIAILDKDYRFDYVTTGYKEIMGISPLNPIGKTPRETFDQQISEIIEERTMSEPSGEGQVDLYIGNKKKSIFYNYFTIEDERGNSKYIHIIRDNTKTEDLQLQLRKQLKEINFYSQAKDSFIANISHEIKTPINAILGMVHFLKSTRLSQNQKELLRKIETSSDILLTIISDVLDLSKIKNNSLSLYPSDFSLEGAIKNVEDMFSSQLTNRGIRWWTEYNFNPSLCLHLDKTRFVQVLVNLINNASKFTDRGYIKLSVETLSENEDTVLLQFCIEDTGIGIAEKDISKLFREFEQLENHLTKQHQGTGLGLFICKNIIESMDGRMWVKSTKGQGSKFYFSLPAKKSLDPRLSAASGIVSKIPLNGGGGKALVVEDTDINAEVAVRLLREVNITCDTASDGIAAIQCCKDKPCDYYHLILMDIHMPNMDGYTSANILKKEMGVKTPIIALTASDINEQIRSEHADTIECFILKPFKVEAFYNAIAPYFPISELPVSGSKVTAEQRQDPFSGREEAIKNMGGMIPIYEKHVQKFKVNYNKSTEHLTALLEEKNYDEARRLAHSIKGLSGTLGMMSLMESSAELEKAILKGDTYDLRIELENFDLDLNAVICAI
ncbi:MAG: response regulator, partial [Bacillota bacterium]|nr:response regulator [Bacillota bacterium]